MRIQLEWYDLRPPRSVDDLPATSHKSAEAQPNSNEPTIENRKPGHDSFIEDTLECRLKLAGTAIKSVRNGQVSLAEGYVMATAAPLGLVLHGVHIAEYAPANPSHQHAPTRQRILLANKREIRKLADRSAQ